MSPMLRVGMIHGAYAAAYRPSYPIGTGAARYPALAASAMYRRGRAVAYRAARGLPPIPRKHYDAGRCWCRARHGNEQPATAPRRTPDARLPAAPPEAAPATSALDRARRAAGR